MRFATIPFLSALVALTVAAPVAQKGSGSTTFTRRSAPTDSMPPRPTGGFPSGFPVMPSGAVPSGVFPSAFPTMPSGAMPSGIFPAGFEAQALAPTGTSPALPSGSGFPHPHYGYPSDHPFKSIAARQEPSGAPPSGAPPMPTDSFSGMPSDMPPMPTGGFPSGFPVMPSGAVPSGVFPAGFEAQDFAPTGAPPALPSGSGFPHPHYGHHSGHPFKSIPGVFPPGVFPPGVFPPDVSDAEAASPSGSGVPHYGYPSGAAPSGPAPSGPVPTA